MNEVRRTSSLHSMVESADKMASGVNMLEDELGYSRDPRKVREAIDGVWQRLSHIMEVKSEVDSAHREAMENFDGDIECLLELGELSATIDRDLTLLLDTLKFLMDLERTVSNYTEKLDDMYAADDVDSQAKLEVISSLLLSELMPEFPFCDDEDDEDDGKGWFGLSEEEE